MHELRRLLLPWLVFTYRLGKLASNDFLDGLGLEFREDALRAVARKAMQRRTGARGLRTILENILLDTMYDLPSLRGVQKVVVDESVIEGHSRPYIVYKAETGTDEPQRKVSGAAN